MNDIYAVPPGTVLEAALEYIERGWHLLPVAGQRGGEAGAKWKAPYGVGHWSRESSRDEVQIRAWFEGNDDLGIGLDMGRSGLVALDGDQHDELIAWAGVGNLNGAPSWHGHPLRRSYLFRQPTEGDPIGCPVRVWGEIRGVGGFMVIPPSPHPIGGRYKWDIVAEPFPLPAALADILRATDETGPSLLVPDATNEQVREFMEQHTASAKPQLLDVIMDKYKSEIAAGAGRYPTVRDHLVWAMEDAAIGMFSAYEAANLLGAAYREDLKRPTARPFDKNEWNRVLRWAVGRARLKDPAERLARVLTTDTPVTLLDVDPESAANDSEPPTLEDLEFRREVAKRARSLRVDQQAKSEVRADAYVKLDAPITLAQLMEMDLTEVEWRVANSPLPTAGELAGGGLLASGGSVVLSGQRKTGKTSLMVDLVACLVDGGLFLGRFPVLPPTGRVYLMDYESHPKQILKWYSQRGIEHIDRLLFQSLRGRPNPFSTEEGRADLAKIWRTEGVESIIVDPLSVLLADMREDENDNHSTRRGLDELRRVAHLAGVQEIIVVAHAGKTAESGSRGASAIEDWPDAIWRLRSEGEGNEAERTFSAFGRDVDLAPSTLSWDHERRRPTLPTIGDATEQIQEHVAEAKALALRTDVHTFFRKKWMGDSEHAPDSRGWMAVGVMRDAINEGKRPSRLANHAGAKDICEGLVQDGRLEANKQGKYRWVPTTPEQEEPDGDATE